MSTTFTLPRRSAETAGYRHDLPLAQDLEAPIVVDASAVVGPCHPMFVLRLRIFVEWHRFYGRPVVVRLPEDATTAQELADLRCFAGLPDGVVVPAIRPDCPAETSVLSLTQLVGAQQVEDAAFHATEVLHAQAPALAAWGDPVHMAVSELCGNAIQHGRSDDVPAFVAADRTDGDHRIFRLAIADLGIGIPEHIRGRHPEWHDDTAAITRALVRGVTGTKDPHRGNGFAEVFDEALARQLIRSGSAVSIDIRSGKGRVIIDLVDGRQEIRPGTVGRPRRGTWITYTVTTI